jgi:hypothetical protein
MTFVVGVKSVGHARTLAQRMCEFADDARMSIRRIYCLRWLTQEARATFIAGVTKDHERSASCPTSRMSNRWGRPCRLDDSDSETTPQRIRDRITQRT